MVAFGKKGKEYAGTKSFKVGLLILTPYISHYLHLLYYLQLLYPIEIEILRVVPDSLDFLSAIKNKVLQIKNACFYTYRILFHHWKTPAVNPTRHLQKYNKPISAVHLLQCVVLIQVQIGEVIAVRSSVYKDRPLLGRVKELRDEEITVEWFMGSYSGTWKEWTGRVNGKRVVYTDTIQNKDIIQTSISFTPTMHLPTAIVTTLKTRRFNVC